jgi:hypothetical protein
MSDLCPLDPAGDGGACAVLDVHVGQVGVPAVPVTDRASSVVLLV